MEVKIPKEIRDYKDTIFFGLDFRQFIFSFIAIGISVVIYFLLKDALGTETVTWVCILFAAPFAFAGFFKRNGLNFEQYVLAWIKSEFLLPKRLTYRSENLYFKALKHKINLDPNKETKTIEGVKENVKNFKNNKADRKRSF